MNLNDFIINSKEILSEEFCKKFINECENYEYDNNKSFHNIIDENKNNSIGYYDYLNIDKIIFENKDYNLILNNMAQYIFQSYLNIIPLKYSQFQKSLIKESHFFSLIRRRKGHYLKNYFNDKNNCSFTLLVNLNRTPESVISFFEGKEVSYHLDIGEILMFPTNLIWSYSTPKSTMDNYFLEIQYQSKK